MAKISQTQTLYNVFSKIEEPSNETLQKIQQATVSVMNFADEMSSTTSRINLMNDGLQSTDELQNMIFQSAQRSRASYESTAGIVTELGQGAKDAFSSNQETIAFAENINKMYVMAGASQEEMVLATSQLTQALGSGMLSSNDFDEIFKSVPNIIQTMSDYLDLPIGKIKDMASEGQITADILKNAVLSSTDEINSQFDNIPMTFAQLGSFIRNNLLQAFQPVIGLVSKGAQLIYDNWSTLEPIFLGLAAAVAFYSLMAAIQTVVLGFQTAATWLSVGANRALIATMLKHPFGWIALAIGILVGVIYKWVQSVGGIKIAWQIAVNAILTAWDWIKITFFTGILWVLGLMGRLYIGIKGVTNGIANFIGDMKVAVLNILQDMVNGSIRIINKFINLLNKIPGMSIDTIQEVTFGTTAQMENEAAKKAREASLKKDKEVIESLMAIGEDKLHNMKYDAILATAQREAEISIEQKKAQTSSAYNFQDSQNNNLDDIGTENNPVNVKVNDTVDVSNEDLKTMRELAEMKSIQNFVSLTPTVNVKTGDLNNGTDVDAVVGKIKESLNVEIAANAKGAYDIA